ncbi:MAG: DUF1080 domain-containing protein [Bryobacteraceae bacterium]
MKTVALFALAASFAFAADKPEKGFTSLFNGKNLDGWTKAQENEGTFSFKDGAIVANGPRCHLYYTGKVNNHNWKNFELKVDVMTEANSNGGIYFHTVYQEKSWPDKGFEVQVNNTFERDPRKTGSLYMVQDYRDRAAQDKTWFTEHIVVKDNHVSVFVDGKQVVDWAQPADWKGPDAKTPGRVLGAGTFALQGHDPGSTVYYKNIRVKALK